MSALHDLERQLARAVDAGAAADPAATGRELRSSTDAGQPRSTGVRRSRRRPRGRRLLAGILITGLATTGALAATGALRIAPERNAAWMPDLPDRGAGVPVTELRVLPLRVADPLGGPPWVIRTFRTNRNAACAQVGQLYRGRFGLVERDRGNRPVFRLSGVHIGENARCTNRAVAGFPVLQGLRHVRVVGGPTNPARCSGDPGARGACPISAVVVVRFGLLGPQARSARFVGRDGPVGPTLKLAPGSGGAYLFAQRVDPAPWRDSQRREDQIQNELDRRFPREQNYGSLTKAERRESRRRWTERNRAAMRLYRASAQSRRSAFTAMVKGDGVDATFTTGEAFRVAGQGVAHRPLPGVPSVRSTLPARLHAPITVEYRGARRAVRVSFPVPVALDRYAQAYVARVTGPRAPRCGRRLQADGEGWISRAATKGATVSAMVLPVGPGSGPQRRGWCAGRRYTVRVVHHTGTNPGGVDRLVGTSSFVAR